MYQVIGKAGVFDYRNYEARIRSVVKSLIRRCPHLSNQKDDMLGVAGLVFVRAAGLFEESPAQFGTYLYKAVWRELLYQFVRPRSKRVRVYVKAEIEAVKDHSKERDDRETVEAILSVLDEQEREVLQLELHGSESMAETARTLSLTRSRVHQIRTKAVSKIRVLEAVA